MPIDERMKLIRLWAMTHLLSELEQLILGRGQDHLGAPSYAGDLLLTVNTTGWNTYRHRRTLNREE